MEEKILLSSKSYSAKWIPIAFVVLGLLFAAVPCLITYTEFAEKRYDMYEFAYSSAKKYYSEYESADDYAEAAARVYKPNLIEFLLEDVDGYGRYGNMTDDWHWAITPAVIIMLSGIVFYFAWRKHSIVITDRRVYGNSVFGKRVDIPNDSISAVSSIGLLKGVTVASSSGKIGFFLIKNADEMYAEISRVLIERQKKIIKNTEENNIVDKSNADEIKKYKELLDTGVITQEEFDAKKKQLLDL